MSIELLRERITTMFSDLTFDSQRHLYFWDGVRVPKSVTGLIKEYQEPFDVKKWSRICAIKEGITEHEIIHKWQTMNKDGCQLGTETHDYLEVYDGVITPGSPQERAGIKFLVFIMQDYEIVFKELRMYSRRYNFAGTTDLLLRHKITRKLAIVDYKTNKDLFRTFGLLLPPFGYLESHPFNLYQLQLSDYQLMLEEISCPISERIVVHLKADETYKIWPCWDFTSEMKQYLDSKL